LLNNESIGEILSTKAVIADIEREVVQDKEPTSREIKKKMKKLKELTGVQIDIKDKEKVKMYILNTHSKFYSKRKPRQKVMETILQKN